MNLARRIERALDCGTPTELDPQSREVVDVRPLAASAAEAAEVRFADGSRTFAKCYLGRDAAARLQGEARGLRALGDILGTPASIDGFALVAPRILRSDADQRLLLCEWIDTASGRGDQRGFADALVEMQQRALRCSPEEAGFPVPTYLGETVQDNRPAGEWAEFFVERRLQVMLDLLASVAPQAVVRALERLCTDAPEILRESEEANVLLHGDLWSGNLLWTDRGAALIDPAVYWGHREAELGMLTLFGGLGSDFYDRYRDLWPLAPGWQRRVAVYRLYHVLNHRVLFGSSYDGSAIRLLNQLVSDD